MGVFTLRSARTQDAGGRPEVIRHGFRASLARSCLADSLVAAGQEPGGGTVLHKKPHPETLSRKEASMRQAIRPPLGGLSLGPIGIYFGKALDPNAAAADNAITDTRTFPATAGDLAACGIGSLYISTGDGSLWQKTGATDGRNPTGVWTARS